MSKQKQMKSRKEIAIALIVAGWLLVGAMMALAINFSPGTIPFPYEPNQIVGKKLGGVQIEATEFMIVDINCTHPRDFPFVITVVSAPTGIYILNDGLSWNLQWATDTNDTGTHYVVIEATDTPPPPWKSKTRQGTIVIQVVELNPGPILHELENTVIADATLKRQQIRWQELRKQKTIMVGPVRVPLEWEINGQAFN